MRSPKNLNEQIERINNLFNYEVGVVITEQQTPEVKVTPENNPGLSYFITAGASNTPMRSVTLNKNQGFPLPKDATSTDVYMYEIKLSDALNDNFSVATILNKVDDKKRDQIIFGNESIVNTGTIRIPINQTTINQTIKVSGNGALVLSRASNEYQKIKKLGGMMSLELSAKQLYSNYVSIESLGITQPNLISKANSLLSGLIYQVNNDTGKSELDPRLTPYQTYPDQFWISTKDLNGKVIPANIKWSDKINQFKNTIDKSNYKSKYDAIAKAIKADIISPALNQLPSTVAKFLSTNFPSLPKDILDQIVVSLNTTIKSTDDKLNVQYIKKYFDDWSYVKSTEGTKSSTPTPKVKTTDTKYKEGQG